ncbi:hypothetical protein ACIRU3_33015 [Streptomyces sp. NPDC101151]|uniref:hypothetical protein n=1 Tax=Streptomyces sp. NPDC101151 TaxID=3366115 RepID=UPI00382AA8EA
MTITAGRAGVGLICAVAAVGLLAGCSNASPQGEKPPKPTVSKVPGVTSIPHLTDTADLALPVDAYMPTGRDLLQTTDAMTTLEQRCVSRYGLKYTPTEARLPNFSKNSRRYGVPESLQVAREFGFHMTQNDPRSLPKHLGTPPSQEVRTVLTASSPQGPLTSYHGISLPKGGCVAEADRALTGGDEKQRAGHSPVAEEIRAHSFEYSQLDPRVIAAQTAWKKCMSAQGYTNYKKTFDASGDERWNVSTATSQEIAVAVADWQCAKQVNLVGVWSAVESAYQNAEIEKHAEELQQARDGLRQQSKRVATVLAGGKLSGS